MLKRLSLVIVIIAAFCAGILVSQVVERPSQNLQSQIPPDALDDQQVARKVPLPTNTRRPSTGDTEWQKIAQIATDTPTPIKLLPTLTPSRTLRPPPTLEPPTATIPATMTLTPSPTPTTEISVVIPGLHGDETATPTSTPGCTPRKDWKLTYTVQRNDALSRIADTYNTAFEDLMAANCLTDKNLIVIGQVLKVPGQAHPDKGPFECIGYTLLTPMNGTLAVPASGSITFAWRGPRANYNLIRILDSSGNKIHEVVIELRQNESINVGTYLPKEGTYTWYVYPLDSNFVQACPEGGPWTFYKPAVPVSSGPSGSGSAPISIQPLN